MTWLCLTIRRLSEMSLQSQCDGVFHSAACPPSYSFINNNNLSRPPDLILMDKLAHPSRINHTPPYIRTYSVPWAVKVKGLVVQPPPPPPCPFVHAVEHNFIFCALHGSSVKVKKTMIKVTLMPFIIIFFAGKCSNIIQLSFLLSSL